MATGASENTSSPAPPAYIRLHITPLTPAILPSIIPASILPSARNISYHTLQTFPEKPYGFVELPVMTAEKIKKKLNGATLKGTKVRIEEARPQKELQVDDEMEEPVRVKKIKSSKKRTRDTETLPAVELRDRKVKRGWTDPDAPARSEKKTKVKKDKKTKKDAVRSKYTTGPECLFRTKSGTDEVVHEFKSTVFTKNAGFLRSDAIPAGIKNVAEYVEGEGWVNEDGEVVEAPAKLSKRASAREAQQVDESLDSAVSSEVEDVSEDDSLAEKEAALMAPVLEKAKVLDDSTSSSGESSSEEDSDTESDSTSDSSSAEEISPNSQSPSSRPISSSGAPVGLTISIPMADGGLDKSSAVHPLEALFKRRRPDAEAPSVNDTPPSFSFFAADNDEDDDEHSTAHIPMTPFTQQDFQHRGLRSAAPTPDTAHPSRVAHIRWPGSNDNDGDDEDEVMSGTPSHKKKSAKPAEGEDGAPVSDFQKWFYEHRGEMNRAWKKEKKTAGKEKRQRENKKRSGRL
jgi:hypothetical protein